MGPRLELRCVGGCPWSERVWHLTNQLDEHNRSFHGAPKLRCSFCKNWTTVAKGKLTKHLREKHESAGGILDRRDRNGVVDERDSPMKMVKLRSSGSHKVESLEADFYDDFISQHDLRTQEDSCKKLPQSDSPPDQPEMEIDDIKLKDIFARSHLTMHPRKLVNNATYVKKSLLFDPSLIKHEPSYPTGRLGTQSNPLVMDKNMKLTGKNAIGRVNTQERSFKTLASPSETDEEDWIKSNIINVESNESGPNKIIRKAAVRPATKIKTNYPQQPDNIIVSRKWPSMEASQIRAGKKIILDASSVMKNSYTMKTSTVGQNKRIIVNRPTVVPDDLIDDTDADETDN